jgi:hypothetical protein
MMRSVTIRLRAAEFSATMTAMREWLDANRYEPTMYKYYRYEHTLLVTVDFAAEMAAEAFATRLTASITHLRNLHRLTACADPPRNRQGPPRPTWSRAPSPLHRCGTEVWRIALRLGGPEAPAKSMLRRCCISAERVGL